MPQATRKKNSSATAIVFAVFAVVCIVAFLAYRGSDVGKLAKLIGNLGGGPLVHFEGLRDSVAGVIAACLVGISWFGLGSFVSSLIGTTDTEDDQPGISLISDTAIGAAVWSLMWFFLGLVGAYSGV